MANDVVRYQEAMRVGEAYNRQEQWKQGFQAFRRALAEFPQRPEPYAGLGDACFGLKMVDRALESYKLAARYSRGDIRYIQQVADLQERLGQLGEAARTYMAAGELELRQRRLESAVANWERACRLEPALLGAHRRLAMVFQRQDNVKSAVREYLAIARILQLRSEKEKALQMCQAALRLDPENEDVRLAMELVRYGEQGVASEPEPVVPISSEEAAEREEMAETVRQIAHTFEEEQRSWQAQQTPLESADPVVIAASRAQDELAEEIFREEDVEAPEGRGALSKLERDALLGQGMDFQARGQVKQAITCYERAIAGGLRLPAALFTLGLLYLQDGQKTRAKQAFARAAQDASYVQAMRLTWQHAQS